MTTGMILLLIGVILLGISVICGVLAFTFLGRQRRNLQNVLQQEYDAQAGREPANNA